MAQAGSDSLASQIEMREKTTRLLNAAAALGELTSLLIRSPEHAAYTIADMEWLIVPAIADKQFLIVRGPAPGEPTPLPAAAVLWVSVSDELDALFKSNIGQRYRLTAEQRVSGSNVWITDVVGEPLIWNKALAQLMGTAFKGRKVAMVRRNEAGEPSLIEHPAT